MKVSLNTVKQYISFELPPTTELIERINEQLGKVETVNDLVDTYKDAVVVQLKSCEKHPSADRLNICFVDDGGFVQDVPRTDEGLVQVVCGAPNVREGMYAVWLPPRSVVPATYGDEEPFVLGARELRGVVSQGMLAAADELAVGNDHDGILELSLDEWRPSDQLLQAGASFAKLYGLDDTIIDIENKMFTHRPDCFGQIGVARELAGILGQEFVDPEWYWKIPEFVVTEGLDIEIINEAGENVPRFMAVALKNVEIKPSPLWLQCSLIALGSKPINNVVDITNYVMLLTAQPTHAYDYDKLRGHKLGVRMAKAGESVKLLNDKTYQLTDDDIVIIDGEGPVGLAGIMGGANSEISESTKNVVLEVATFDMYVLRKTSMRHGVFTDALTRFNKGQSPLQNDRVLQTLLMSIKDISMTEQASPVIDLQQDSVKQIYDQQTVHEPLFIERSFINDRLGLEFTNEAIMTLLSNVHFDCTSVESTDALTITAPFWRTDIELREDIVEEVGRLYGFDKLPRELPMRTMKPTALRPQIQLKADVRNALSKAGANEILTYSFVHENVMTRAGQNSEFAYRLSNALSPDLQYYRLSLTPSLLDKINANIRAGYDEFALFEIGKGHSKQVAVDDDSLPLETHRVGLVYSAKHATKGASFYQAKSILEFLATSLKLELDYEPLTEASTDQTYVAFDYQRSALVVSRRTNTVLGIVGEYTQQTKRAFKLPQAAAGFELLLDELQSINKQLTTYTPLSKYPSIDRDVTFVCETSMSYRDIVSNISAHIREISVPITVALKDIYQANSSSNKHMSFVFTIKPELQTMTSDQASAVMNDIIAIVEQNTTARAMR